MIYIYASIVCNMENCNKAPMCACIICKHTHAYWQLTYIISHAYPWQITHIAEYKMWHTDSIFVMSFHEGYHLTWQWTWPTASVCRLHIPCKHFMKALALPSMGLYFSCTTYLVIYWLAVGVLHRHLEWSVKCLALRAVTQVDRAS